MDLTTTRHRGECKLPGGKLVAVSIGGGIGEDDTIDAGGARIDGDFFVEGDAHEAHALIADLEAAIDAAAGGTTCSGAGGDAARWTMALAMRLRTAMDAHDGATLVGADERTIATATARALGIGAGKGRAFDGTEAGQRDAHGANRSANRGADHGTPAAADGSSAPVASALPDVRDIAGLMVVRDVPREPAMQLALDQACAEAVAAGAMPPLLRFWQWDRAAVVIGRFQSLGSEVHVDQAAAEDVTVVRRITGGGAMFAEPDAVITYSLVAPLGFVEGMDVEDSYRACDGWVLDALRSMGIDARYQPINDIASDRGKIGGAAQRRFPAPHGSGGPGAVLHHTMMSYDMDAAKMMRILNVSREKMSDKAVRSAARRVDPLRSQTGMARADVIARMIATLVGTAPAGIMSAGATDDHVAPAGTAHGHATLRPAADAIPDAVLRRARELADRRYATPGWTAIIP